MTFMPGTHGLSSPRPYRRPAASRYPGAIVLMLLGLLASMVLLAFTSFLVSEPPGGEVADLLIILFPPVTALTSAVVGFHYGSSTRGRD
jgi:hypothetical protein